MGNVSDGYHTFNELYEFRKVYNAVLFNEWARLGKYEVHKSRKHHDGTLCFGGGWFIGNRFRLNQQKCFLCAAFLNLLFLLIVLSYFWGV